MVYGPSFLYLVVSTVMAASRTRFCEYAEVAAVGAAAAAPVVGLAAGAVVAATAGAVVGVAAGAAVGGAAGAVVGAGAGAVGGLAAETAVGAAAGGAEHALTVNAPAVTMARYERSFIWMFLMNHKVRRPA